MKLSPLGRLARKSPSAAMRFGSIGAAARGSGQPRRFSTSLDIAGEPAGPAMILTSFPGPEQTRYTDELGQRTCNLAVKFPVDMSKSIGNYIADVDGNVYLDVFMNISSTCMGYNHPDVLAAARSDQMVSLVANRTASGVHPLSESAELLEQAFFADGVAPAGFNRVATAVCGSTAVEAAFKHAFISYAQQKRGGMGVLPTEEEYASCMKNQGPGSPNYAILSFNKGFHGRMFGCLSTTRTAPLHKVSECRSASLVFPNSPPDERPLCLDWCRSICQHSTGQPPTRRFTSSRWTSPTRRTTPRRTSRRSTRSGC